MNLQLVFTAFIFFIFLHVSINAQAIYRAKKRITYEENTPPQLERNDYLYIIDTLYEKVAKGNDSILMDYRYETDYDNLGKLRITKVTGTLQKGHNIRLGPVFSTIPLKITNSGNKPNLNDTVVIKIKYRKKTNWDKVGNPDQMYSIDSTEVSRPVNVFMKSVQLILMHMRKKEIWSTYISEDLIENPTLEKEWIHEDGYKIMASIELVNIKPNHQQTKTQGVSIRSNIRLEREKVNELSKERANVEFKKMAEGAEYDATTLKFGNLIKFFDFDQVNTSSLVFLKKALKKEKINIYLLNESKKTCSVMKYLGSDDNSLLFKTSESLVCTLYLKTGEFEYQYDIVGAAEYIDEVAWEEAKSRCSNIRSYAENSKQTIKFKIEEVLRHRNYKYPIAWITRMQTNYCARRAFYTDCRIHCVDESKVGESNFTILLTREFAESMLEYTDIEARFK